MFFTVTSGDALERPTQVATRLRAGGCILAAPSESELLSVYEVSYLCKRFPESANTFCASVISTKHFLHMFPLESTNCIALFSPSLHSNSRLKMCDHKGIT